jgi:hypothetical protein
MQAAPAQKEELLPAIAGGELMLALAHHEAGGRYALDRVATTATAAGNGWTLDGAKAVVLGASGGLQVHRFRTRCKGHLAVPGRCQGARPYAARLPDPGRRPRRRHPC